MCLSQCGMIAVLFIVLVVLAALMAHLTMCAPRRRYAAYGAGESSDSEDDGAVYGMGRPFRLSIREPWYSAMQSGKKVIDGRLRRGAFADDAAHPLKVGDPIMIARSRPAGDTTEHPGLRHYDTKIVRLTKYKTFAELLKAEGVGKVLPGMKSDKEAVSVLSAFHEEGDEEKYGVVAIEVAPA